jgi:hypothetical protein
MRQYSTAGNAERPYVRTAAQKRKAAATWIWRGLWLAYRVRENGRDGYRQRLTSPHQQIGPAKSGRVLSKINARADLNNTGPVWPCCVGA